ncbi:MAG: PDZ domain-containing protein [Planctomycetes bacterium]|nr:PDZ domain-containing protein [Planctomycetota bacterium]
MLEGLMGLTGAAGTVPLLGSVLGTLLGYVLIILGFSFLIFVHELGHFLAAKGCGVRVHRFAVGFGKALLSFRKGLGFRWGSSEEEYLERLTDHVEQNRQPGLQFKEKTSATDEELSRAAEELKIGETEYRFNWLPLGGYVKMQGQEDFEIDKSGEIELKNDPRSFLNKSVGRRMIIVSAGVVMNAIFAAILFMATYMIGRPAIPPIVGGVMPGWPADRAGLLPGDRIIEVNGERIADFENLQMATVLADPNKPMSIVFERQEKQDEPPVRNTVEIQPNMDDVLGVLVLGIRSAGNNIIAGVWPDPKLAPDEQPQIGDEVLEADGRKIANSQDLLAVLQRQKGGYANLVVRRALEDGTTVTREVKASAQRRLLPRGEGKESDQEVLGFMPRTRIASVDPNKRADLAGLKAGDVILQWGEQSNPVASEVREVIKDHGERDIRVEVLRSEGLQAPRRVQLVVRPEAGAFGRGKPRVGMTMEADTDGLPAVADIATEVREGVPSAAAALKGKLPRGSVLVSMNGESVASWGDVIDRCFKFAGSDVQVVWRTPEGLEQRGVSHIPATIGTVFPLPGDHVIVRINGRRTAEAKVRDQYMPVPVGTWLAASHALESCVGQKVEIEHRGIQDRTSHTEVVEVTSEMLDTWPMRIAYDRMSVETFATREHFREPNPFKAMMIGVHQTYYFIEMVYLIIQRMVVDRSVGFDTVAGPIGIVKAGSDIAQEDFGRLLYFLALISANLAVINFLPLPIFDGGVMVFLIIEKIKGSPIPIKIQVVTQLVGLALIITIFAYVMLNDIQRIFG